MPNIHRTSKNILRLHCGEYDRYSPHVSESTWEVLQSFNIVRGWTLPVRDVLIYSGAKFLCPVAGTITLMPGTSSDPAFRRVDVDVKTGKVKGLF